MSKYTVFLVLVSALACASSVPSGYRVVRYLHRRIPVAIKKTGVLAPVAAVAPLAVASAGSLPVSLSSFFPGAPVATVGVAPLASGLGVAKYTYPRYKYEYSVADAFTGDNKKHVEFRDGSVVSGSYSFVEPDGSIRAVKYTSDPINGFNAVVSKLGANTHPAPAQTVVKRVPVVRRVRFFG